MPSLPLYTRGAALLALLLCAGCSQNALLTKQDYAPSQQHFLQGDNENALLDFPRRAEERTFITTMEKTYLSLLQHKPGVAALQKQDSWLQNKVRYYVSREARTFFYVRTPEDYYPGEHEVIWMHLLLGWGYAQQGKRADAYVEAREAGTLLTLPWSPNGHFDDPMLRLFLAGLWTMCGDWREAQVDFRAAYALDPKLTWAAELGARDKPPAHLFIVLGGPGPAVEWDPEFNANPLRSSRRVKFVLRGRKSQLSMMDSNGMVIPTRLSPDAAPWYRRHLERESELDELIQDSAYGGKAAAQGTATAGWIIGAAGLGVIVAGGGVALGILIIKIGTADAVKLGLGVAAFGILKGLEIAEEGYDESTTQLKQELDASIHYRFVRYLPEYLWMGWSDKPVTYPVRVSTPSESAEISQPTPVAGISVSVAQLPDIRRTTCSYKLTNSSTYETAADAAGNCPPAPDF